MIAKLAKRLIPLTLAAGMAFPSAAEETSGPYDKPEVALDIDARLKLGCPNPAPYTREDQVECIYTAWQAAVSLSAKIRSAIILNAPDIMSDRNISDGAIRQAAAVLKPCDWLNTFQRPGNPAESYKKAKGCVGGIEQAHETVGAIEAKALGMIKDQIACLTSKDGSDCKRPTVPRQRENPVFDFDRPGYQLKLP